MASDIKLLDDNQIVVEGTLTAGGTVIVAGQFFSSGEFFVGNPFGNAEQPTSTFCGDIYAQRKVGIGTPDPGYQLDVGSRMRVRQSNETAGIWFYQANKDQAFVGMSTDTQVGFWGNTGAGWGLVMDTTTGNVGIGTPTPKHKLDVAGNAQFTSISLGDIKPLKPKPGVSITENAITALGFDSSLVINSKTILVKTSSAGFSGSIVLDLVAEIQKLRIEVDALKAKVKP